MHDFPAEGFFFLTPFFKKNLLSFGVLRGLCAVDFFGFFFFLEEELSLAHVFEVQRITSNCETCHDRFFFYFFFVFFVGFVF
jgi:hypothetical protein